MKLLSRADTNVTLTSSVVVLGARSQERQNIGFLKHSCILLTPSKLSWFSCPHANHLGNLILLSKRSYMPSDEPGAFRRARLHIGYYGSRS